jgi:hypothetical protein
MTNQTPPDTNLPAGLSNPARRALATLGITHLDQLTTHRARDIMNLHGMGPKGIRILRQALAERGLAFAGES